MTEPNKAPDLEDWRGHEALAGEPIPDPWDEEEEGGETDGDMGSRTVPDQPQG